MSVITVENLYKHYDKVKAVDGISFEVREGEIFGFLGPNGAGKTTTIEITYFVLPFRSVMVEGAGLAVIGGELLILLAWMVGGWIVAIKTFRWE